MLSSVRPPVSSSAANPRAVHKVVASAVTTALRAWPLEMFASVTTARLGVLRTSPPGLPAQHPEINATLWLTSTRRQRTGFTTHEGADPSLVW